MSDQFDFASIDLEGAHAHLELLQRGCFISLSTVLARTAAVRAVGGVNMGYHYVEDYDLWLRLARLYRFKYVDEPLAKRRMHEHQFTRQRPDVALAEQVELLCHIAGSASYPESVRRAIGDYLLGQHRECARRLAEQRRFLAAARAIVGMCRYPDRIGDYYRHRFRTVFDPALRGLDAVARAYARFVNDLRRIALRARRAPGRLRRIFGEPGATPSSSTATGVLRPATPATGPTDVWIDGTPLGETPTGYFNFLCELIRTLARPESGCTVHVATQSAGRAALLARLDGDTSQIRFHRSGWRAFHWREIHGLCFGWHANIAFALLTFSLLAFALAGRNRIALAVALLLLAGHTAVLIDELAAGVRQARGRPSPRLSERLLRFMWRRMPKPRGRPPAPNTVEVVVWRGAFRWEGSRRIAIIQDMTTRIHPELHPAGTVEEFDEFLGYVQRHAHMITTGSEQSRRDIVERIAVNPGRVSVIPMPVSPMYARPSVSRGFVAFHGITRPYVLCVGSIEPRKNLRRLVRAFELLKEEPAAREHLLVLAGPDGWDPEFRRFLVTSDVYPRVRMLGFVPGDHLPSLYHFASAVIYPSLYEGFGLPVLEAMASSAVVLASRISSLPEVLGEDGIQFDPYSTEGMAAALLHALSLGPADAADYRRRCRARADLLFERWATQPPLPGLLTRQYALT